MYPGWHKQLLNSLNPACRLRPGRSLQSVTHRLISSPSHHGANRKSYPSNPGETTSGDRSRLRNIGIIAHINAGKTTTTERLLYLSGRTDYMGDVDKGNTVTDYLVQERDRGITITSAAVTFNWNKHLINLIDTPGHVDFTMEVERSLSVLDGAVTILDSSAGVEAQTITVWNQAAKYQLPNVIFLNKYDKPQADHKMCMNDLRLSLGVNAQLVQLPVKPSSKGFKSVIDVISREYICWTEPEQNMGRVFSNLSIAQCPEINQEHAQQVEEARESLVNSLADLDEELASHVIECDKIGNVEADLIRAALTRATLDCKINPVLVGSSFKYIGCQQLLDSIVAYLPSPIEREKQIRQSLVVKEEAQASQLKEANCAFIFKISHDKRLGPLSYARVCSGSIKRQQRLKNLDTGKMEEIKKIYRAFADELKEIDKSVHKDDIVVLTGLSESRTGDILISENFVQSDLASGADDQQSEPNPSLDGSVFTRSEQPFVQLDEKIIVPRINRMEPVYFCSIEAPSISQQMKLEQALTAMAREDPSFSFEIDSMGVTTIRGMGRLHLEVARDRIESEHGVGAFLGPLQISYRETIQGWATEELAVNRLVNSVNNSMEIKLSIAAKPNAGRWTGKMLRLDTSPGQESNLGTLRNDHRKAIELGLMSAMRHGPSLGYPMIDCDILLLDFRANGRCGLPVISSTATQCLQAAIKRCSPVLLEPIMLLEVVGPHEQAGAILSDLTGKRRAIIVSTNPRPSTKSIVVRAMTPLATLADYSEYLRITTSGRGSFSMELANYTAMSEADKLNLVRL